MRQTIKKSQPGNNIPQPAIELTPPHKVIEKNQEVIYDTELENTVKSMKNKTGFYQAYEDPEHSWMWNGFPNKRLGGKEVQINDEKYKKTPGIQKIG